MSNLHTFGCPCYLLDHRLQSGTGKIPKQEPWVRMDVYVGRLPSHPSNDGLILNPRTGHVCHNFMWCMMMISPQCLICVQQLFLHTGPNWSTLPQQLHCTLKAKLEHSNLSPSSMLTWMILHWILWILTLHDLQPLLLNIVRDMMGILRELVM